MKDAALKILVQSAGVAVVTISTTITAYAGVKIAQSIFGPIKVKKVD